MCCKRTHSIDLWCRLNHRDLVTYICASKLGHNCMDFGICSGPSHFLNKCCCILNWTSRSKPHRHFNQYHTVFIQVNDFLHVFCKMAAILSRLACIVMCTPHLLYSTCLHPLCSTDTNDGLNYVRADLSTLFIPPTTALWTAMGELRYLHWPAHIHIYNCFVLI